MYQAGRHGTAIGLLKETYGLGIKALEMRSAWKGLGGSEREWQDGGRVGAVGGSYLAYVTQRMESTRLVMSFILFVFPEKLTWSF